MYTCPILGILRWGYDPTRPEKPFMKHDINNSHVPNNASKIESKINYSSKFES
jgi:hypothetical protein